MVLLIVTYRYYPQIKAVFVQYNHDGTDEWMDKGDNVVQ